MDHTLQLGSVQVDEDKLSDLCRRYRVRELLVFGSAARGEMRRKVDLVSKKGLKPLIRAGVLKEAHLLYAA